MRWEFYFADHDPQRLSSVCQQLSSLGYTNLEILGPSPDNDDKSLVFLQFAIVEALTPASLASRCSELEAIASRLGIESFDGYDISHPDGRP